MDKSIEERAKEYALNYDDKYQVAMFKAYIEGATEYREIDLETIIDKCVVFDKMGKPIRTKEDLIKVIEE